MAVHTCELEDVPPEDCDQCMRERDEDEYWAERDKLDAEFGRR